MADETVKLKLDLGDSSKDTGTLVDKLDLLKKAADGVGGEFGGLVGKSLGVIHEFWNIADAAKTAGEQTKIGLGDIASGASNLFGSLKAGDVGETIQNVAGVIKLVPGLNSFAPAIDAVGKAASAAWPLVKEWVEYIGKASETKLKDAVTELENYAKALEKTSAALKETDSVLAAREADKAAKEEPKKQQKERAETFEFLTKGRGEQTLEEITEALDPERAEREEKIEAIKEDYSTKRQAMMEKAKKQGRSDIWIEVEDMYLQRKAKEQMAAVGTGEEQQKEAEELLAKARTGDEGALKRLQDILPEGSTTREVARMASPEAQDERKAEQRDLAEQARVRAEQEAYERSHPEIAQEREAARKAAQRRDEEAGARSGGFEVLPELGTSPEQGQGPAAGLPKDLGIGNEVIRGVLPVQQAQGEAIDLLGRVITDVAATANNQMTIIQKLRLMEQNTRGAISSTRSAASGGTY